MIGVGPGFEIGGPICAKAAVEASRIDTRRKRLRFFIITLIKLWLYKKKEASDSANLFSGSLKEDTRVSPH